MPFRSRCSFFFQNIVKLGSRNVQHEPHDGPILDEKCNYFRNYHWLALAYAKKHKLEFWLQGEYGTGDPWGKDHVTLVDMKQMHEDIKASVE